MIPYEIILAALGIKGDAYVRTECGKGLYFVGGTLYLMKIPALLELKRAGFSLEEATEYLGSVPVICLNDPYDLGRIYRALTAKLALPEFAVRERVLDPCSVGSFREVTHYVLGEKALTTIQAVRFLQATGTRKTLRECMSFLKGLPVILLDTDANGEACAWLAAL